MNENKDSEMTEDYKNLDDEFNKEMEKRFTDLMNRARSTTVDEYRKK